ncbi:uncharacterized protein LOC124819357 isoform X1 [Hydra vulgaris]|uniref:uncharacterized protein LOC124819357 isoform X1 n=1 Tax=Hydra vulgaris TaxID=6087 RepID=UPI001F5E706A|nr:uncharacterized protein LOC124819357 [Hydra vulgaris]XP_047146833.1 uncharacterized protein LOC124819357 [Hydra vulgaris]XP_047146834.1 uncharacterized protein LOC124819357 [Hydra vulgaris]XP_047146835.1 uncharacterized protein LOC124819357 [Hydra vulgaris]XP_047146836.1 uncharacterized protein LOC124819357 [Hydra vulgaris]
MEGKSFHIEKNNQMELFIHHVFLTRQLPYREEEENSSGTLLKLVYSYLPNNKTPMPGLNSVRKTMKIWKSIQCSSVSEVQIRDSLVALEPGQTFAIYVRAHNSVITVRLSNDNNALMSVFRALPSNEKVLIEGDLFQTFPERAVSIPFDRLLSDAFSRQVAILCNKVYENTLTTALKAGVKYPDYFDVAEPVFVISWLLGAMSGAIQGEESFERVHKVIRHEVLYGKGSENPWRRSGEWFAIKCVLQIMLVIELGKNEGTVVYKSLMIYIMTSFLEDLPDTYKDTDIIMQMLSKVSRRMTKLKNYIDSSNQNMKLSNQTITWTNIVFKNGCDILLKRRHEADNRWINHKKSCSKFAMVKIFELRPCEHIIHNLNSLTITRIEQAFKQESNSKVDIKNSKCTSRNTWSGNVNFLFDISFLENSNQNNETEIKLYDFEVWVRTVLWKDFLLNITEFLENSSQLFDLFYKYLEISLVLYANDPVGLSQMVLTLLLITAALDSIALKKFPLLAEYHSSFEDKYFDSLLTPLLEDMKYLHSVKGYFSKRNTLANYPSIISNNLNENSFGPRLANKNETMQQIRKDILMYAEKQREKKIIEFQQSFDCYNNLIAKYPIRSHYHFCKANKRCCECETYKKAYYMTIERYEDPIPENCDWKQNAIVFELSIPVSIRCLRDALVLVHNNLDEKQFQKVFIEQQWKSHPQLGSWVSSECLKSLVSIGSNAALISSSRFRLRLINSCSDVLVPCGLSIKLFIKYKNEDVECKIVDYEQINKNFYTMKVWNKSYEIDETWIEGTTHTENEVLASQIKCPLNLKLDEYKAFGSLRAGHRLQLRKLLKAIEMRSLSFESPTVFALIAQALWQAGPAFNKDNRILSDNIHDPVLYFESHSDLKNDGFCHVLIETLSNFLEIIKKNWKKHNQLHIVIIITLRIFSLSSAEIRFEASELLLRCRSIAQKWADEIEHLLSKLTSANLHEIQETRLKLIDVAAFIALTFDVDRCHENIINKESLVYWLQSVARIHDNVCLGNNCFDTERNNLLRRVRQIGLRFENIVRNTFENTLESTYIFNKFLSIHWADFCKGSCSNVWVSHSPPSQTWYYNTFVSDNLSVTLQVNVLSGKFLVDGNPVGRLPDTITKSSVYQRIFGEHVFDVQPSAEQFSTFISVHNFQGSRFLFSNRTHGQVVVERSRSGNEYELIPSDVFNGLFPNHFINKYSHWLCKNTNIIYFRPVRFDDDNFFNAKSEEHFPYHFNVENKTLYDLQRKRYLVDINSNTFKEVYSCLNRLELREYVHLWVSYHKNNIQENFQKSEQQLKELEEQKRKKFGQTQNDKEQYQTEKKYLETKKEKPENMQTDQEQFFTEQENMQVEKEQFQTKKMQNVALNVELPRMDLSFKVEVNTGKLFSHEHVGLIVANHQGNIGTLIGLENSLLLHEDKPIVDRNYLGQQKVLVIPHSATVELIESTNHQNVRINLNKLLSPPYFSYNIDNRLCELRGPANHEAWLYLSLLHAATSSSLPDPFTKLTGTESSMRLLQIGRTFSCRPFDQSAIHTLNSISKLAPKRIKKDVYSQQLQTVAWFPKLYSTYGYEGVALASNILLYHSDMYEKLFSTIEKKTKQHENIFTKRAYWRYKTQLNSCAHLDVENEKLIGGVPKREKAWSDINDCPENNVSRLLMEDYYKRNGISYDPSGLWAIVEVKKSIKKPQVFSLSSVYALEEFDILDNYLQLYELAQNIHDNGFDFCFLLSLLAFKGKNKDLLFSLLAVVLFQIQVYPPSVRNYEYLNETEFDLKKIRNVIKEEFNDINLKSKCLEDEKSYNNFKQNAVIMLENAAQKQWETKKVDFFSIGESILSNTNNNHTTMFAVNQLTMSLNDVVNIDKIEEKVKNLFLRWKNNNELKLFLNEVECKIRSNNLHYKNNNAKLFNQIYFPPLSDTKRTYQSSSKAYEIKIPIKNLEENQDAISLFQNKSSAPMFYIKTNCDTLNRKNQSDKVMSFVETLTDQYNYYDDISNFMQTNLTSSCTNIQENKLSHLNKKNFENNKIIYECRSCLSNSKSKSLWKEVEDAFMPQNDNHLDFALLYGGLWRRVTPVTIIPCILPLESLACTLLGINAKYEVPQSVINRIGALIVSWTNEQRAIRCLKLIQNKTLNAALYQEIINIGHEYWIPSSNPEWLLFELESNFLIRPIQIDVAQSIISANENFVQQLNMGEGKTSVIVPLLAISLATSKHVVRVNVLRPLLNTNFELLSDKLGGLLNKRVYILPCSRDLNLNPSKILRVYRKCLFGRGIMLTTPEYRLSLNLKTLEHCLKKSRDAKKLYRLRCWIQKHVRDILDEADEILNVKYQVIYTIGEQLLVDSGELRWIISQAVLKLVNKFIENIFKIYGENYIEYYKDDTRYDSFSHIRFLNSNKNMYEYLCCLIVDSILNNEVPEVSVAANMKQRDKEIAKLFITSNDISNLESNKRLSKLFKKNPFLKEKLLVLRGLLLFEVLHMALQKRWRVNYGVSLSKPFSKMAVPYRAKDVASERTEFGHPDMAIILTQISYYMSGLSKNQLDEVFINLEKSANKEVQYEQWITSIGIANVPKDLRELNGVNLDSIKQKKKLYSLLSYSMSVINFWLNQVVYPREAKQFPHKISTSAWDLCLKKDHGLKYKNYTSGFSGTNELQLLFPLNIRQNDLSKVIGTNAMVLSFLLQPENKTYYHNNSCLNTIEECILKKLVETKACVLIDVGALMLKMDNEKVAQVWLKLSLASDVSAAIYFDKEDRIMVYDRKGRNSLLSVSPYFHKLNKCVIYLDDIHTRGTDLKFPVPATACVTLGEGLTKDRLVQACMRMRMLGNGHSVYFYASRDVHTSIVNQISWDRIPETSDILKWAISNSCNAIRDGFLHWSSQGLRYATKEAVEFSIFKNKIRKRILKIDSLQELGNRCSENEVIKLESFYGGTRSLDTVPKIVENSLNERIFFFKDNNEATKSFEETITSIGENIISRCSQYVSEYKRFASILNEEQERELEAELEEERQVKRPSRQKPHKPVLSKEIVDLVKTGNINHRSHVEILPINKIFQNTNRISKLTPMNGWSPNFMVSKEFTMVIEDSKRGDDFLFEISWVIVVSPKNNTDHNTYILISSYEANELIPMFRLIKKNCGVRLHMFAPRLRRNQNILINQNSLVLPYSETELLDDSFIAQLSVLAGGLFLLNKDEEVAYSNFLGIFQNFSFNNALEIDESSYIPPCKKRKLETQKRNFKKNIVKFAVEILRARGRCMGFTLSDVCQLLFHRTRNASLLKF